MTQLKRMLPINISNINFMSINEKIVKTAKRFLGQQEIKGNKGFEDPDFESKMKSIGFQSGHAWCSYFAELVWTEAYANNEKVLEVIRKNFSGSSYRTLKKFESAGYPAQKEAEVGSVVIWRKKRNGEYTQFGHVGIVIEVAYGHFVTIEGNTNAAGSREGEAVAMKQRKYDWNKDNGLELAGFIHPISKVNDVPAFPFTNSEEGNEFREWVNDQYPDVARHIDLDRAGSYNNKFIREAWRRLYKRWLEK